MKMNTAKRLFFSSIARTSYMFISVIVAFFMMPFIISHLGDRWYGIWIIISSVIGYYYLLDFGLATAVTRYVAQYVAKNENYNINIIINTTLVIYSILAVVILLLSVVLCFFLGYFIGDTKDLYLIRIIFIIVGLNLSLEFPFKAFNGIIEAYVRYDLLTYSHLLNLFIRTVLIVYFLSHGHGIITLALVGFFCSAISNILYFSVSKYLFREMQISLKYFKRSIVKELFSFGFWSLVIQIFDQIRFRIDSLIIAFFMTASCVTHYFIGARLAEYFIRLVYGATGIMTPVYTRYYAQNNSREMLKKLIFMTKVNSIMSLFGGGLIIILGRALIERWMGISYMDSYPVLILLINAMIFEAVSYPLINILYAINKHSSLAYLNMMEGIIKIILSTSLIQYYGLLGVALGSAIPIILTRGLLLPVITCRYLNFEVKMFYKSIINIVGFSIAYLIVLYCISIPFLDVPSYMSIIFISIAALPIYGIITFLFAFDKDEKALIENALPLNVARIKTIMKLF